MDVHNLPAHPGRFDDMTLEAFTLGWKTHAMTINLKNCIVVGMMDVRCVYVCENVFYESGRASLVCELFLDSDYFFGGPTCLIRVFIRFNDECRMSFNITVLFLKRAYIECLIWSRCESLQHSIVVTSPQVVIN